MAINRAAPNPSSPKPARELSKARAALLRWFDRNRRDLPWRHTRDPYAIWVSEIMLQQTRVDTVTRYYDRFLERFPTTHALASASEDDVLSAWSGLGYYRRGRLLHQGVREVVARYGGEVPRSAEDRLSLPGIGRYTAGAIGSIAFQLAEPIVDGNVARVLSRVHGIDTPLGRADTERRLWEHASRWVQGSRPGDLNQALMELGATVCMPRSPVCDRCPLRTSCVARRTDQVEALPLPRKKVAAREVQWVALLASSKRDGLCLMRGDKNLFGGLWNLPMAEGDGRARALRLMKDLKLAGTLSARSVAKVQHVLTHRRMQVQLWRVERATYEQSAGLRTQSTRELGALGISRLTLKLLEAAHEHDTKG